MTNKNLPCGSLGPEGYASWLQDSRAVSGTANIEFDGFLNVYNYMYTIFWIFEHLYNFKLILCFMMLLKELPMLTLMAS